MTRHVNRPIGARFFGGLVWDTVMSAVMFFTNTIKCIPTRMNRK